MGEETFRERPDRIAASDGMQTAACQEAVCLLHMPSLRRCNLTLQSRIDEAS